jgi:hypothetical protein
MGVITGTSTGIVVVAGSVVPFDSAWLKKPALMRRILPVKIRMSARRIRSAPP